MPQQHIEDDRLDMYALGRLPREQAAQLDEHFLVCATCRERLRQSEEFAALFRQVAPTPEARPRRARFGWRWPAAGLATAALAVVLLVAIRQERQPMAPAIVSLNALRGPETAARIEAGAPAVLVFDIDAAAGYETRIVDRAGKDVLRLPAETRDGRLAVTVRKLVRGSYWVRVYQTGGADPIAEYGLVAR